MVKVGWGVTSTHLSSGFGIAAAVVCYLGLAADAQAQVDLNIQSRLQIYTIPLAGLTAPQQFNASNFGACLDNAVLIRHLFLQHQINMPSIVGDDILILDPRINDDSKSPLVKFWKQPEHQQRAATIVAEYFSNPDLILRLYRYRLLDLPRKVGGEVVPADNFAADDNKNPLVQFWKQPEHRQLAWDILVDLLRRDPGAINLLIAAKPVLHRQPGTDRKFVLIPEVSTPFCSPQPVPNPQPVVKFSAPFNPTYESNVLKSDLNNSHGASVGFGGALQLVELAPTAPGGRTFDVIALSEQAQSVRYSQYSSKSFDTFITQGAYQHFLGAFGYQSDGRLIPVTVDTPKQDIPPLNMITIDSVAFGFQDQPVFTPGFRSESVDLFTPQVTFNRQNQDLSFDGKSCWAQVLDPRQKGFCYYTDLSLTLGQTFSDVSSQENANIALAATPGWRIPYSDLKLALPMTATARAYEHVAGGRDDLLFQVGPALTYAPAAISDKLGYAYAFNFSLSLTYNQNYSTLPTAAWRGYIAMPILTVAFQPPPPTVK